MRVFPGQGNGVALAQPRFDIDRCAIRPDHTEGLEGRIGKRVDAEDAEVFAGMIGESEEALHDWCGGGDAWDFCQRGEERFVERSADFEIGFAGEEFDTGAE